MFTDLVKYPLEHERLKWEARQVIKDLWGKPHLLLRLKLTGTHFQERALEPVVTVGEVRSRFVEIAEDGSAAYAYFDRPVPPRGVVEFGYGDGPMLRFAGHVTPEAVKALSPELLPKDAVNVEHFFPRPTPR